MPQCPHCQTPYEPGERYCSTCGSFLLHPEQGDHFCPQCGVRVSPRQEYCHECDAPLKGQAAVTPVSAPAAPEAAEAPAGPVAQVKGMQPWVLGIVAGAGVLIVILLILLFSRGAAPPPPPVAPKAEAPAPAPPAPPPVTERAAPAPEQPPAPSPPPPPAEPAKPAPELKEQLQNALSSLREAQLKKNIDQFIGAYAQTFPDLDRKRANALKTWENYDYTNLVFTVDKIQPIDADNALAWVTWYVDTRNRRTQETASATQIYKVRFTKENGQWRIQALEEVDKTGE